MLRAAALGRQREYETIQPFGDSFMGRARPAWYYERQAREAQARQTFLANREPPAPGGTIESRGASTSVFYRSLLIRDGTEARVFSTQARAEALTIVSAAQAGLLTTAPANTTPQPIRGSGVKPTRIHWYRGAATATRERSAWNTSWNKYYQDGTHASLPFSRTTGVFDAADLVEAFNGLFGASGSVRAQALGAQNGRAHITFERAPFSAQT